MDIQYTYPDTSPRLVGRSSEPSVAAPDAEASLFGEDGFSFKDLLDVVNPLQQLPIVGSIYRSLTGDTLSTASRLAGGALLGGPAGFLAAFANVGLDAATGSDIGEHFIAMLTGSGEDQQYAMSAYQAAQKLGG